MSRGRSVTKAAPIDLHAALIDLRAAHDLSSFRPQLVQKRQVALLKAQNKIPEAIEHINKYLKQ